MYQIADCMLRCAAAMCLCLCLCAGRREGRHIPYFAVVYRTPRDFTAVDLLGNKIVTDITLYITLIPYHHLTPGNIPSHNRCSPQPWRIDYRFPIENLSSSSSTYGRNPFPIQPPRASIPPRRQPRQTCAMSCPPTAYRPWWPLRLAVACPASRRTCRDVQAGAAARTLALVLEHGTGARAPLSRGDQRPGPGACCGVGDPWVVRWGTWGWRPQAPAADMADTHQRLVCFALSRRKWVDCGPLSSFSSTAAGDVMNGRVVAAGRRTLPSTNDIPARGRKVGTRTGVRSAPLIHAGVWMHSSRTYAPSQLRPTSQKRSPKRGDPLTYEAAASNS